jgi:hypothetical protein
MNFRLRRVLRSLLIAGLCGVFILIYEFALPRGNPEEDGLLDWLYLSILVAVIVTPLAWLTILLPVSCLLPRQSKLANWKLSIPIGCTIGIVFSFVLDQLMSYLSSRPFSFDFSWLEILNVFLPGILCGTICAILFSYLESRCAG